MVWLHHECINRQGSLARLLTRNATIAVVLFVSLGNAFPVLTNKTCSGRGDSLRESLVIQCPHEVYHQRLSRQHSPKVIQHLNNGLIKVGV
jgi:hypothetical protein